jgi:hypothetical protein
MTDKRKNEIRKMTQGMVKEIDRTKEFLNRTEPGMGDQMLDVLIADIKQLHIPTLAALATRKAMLSQPMAGQSKDQIKATREKAIAALKAKGYTVINTLFSDEWYSQESMARRGVVQVPMCFLAKSLENMSLCHAAYFCKGWESARGCRIEHETAKAYGLEIIYEDESKEDQS